ncbi:hypothetical protein [Staphylococcus aureus]
MPTTFGGEPKKKAFS